MAKIIKKNRTNNILVFFLLSLTLLIIIFLYLFFNGKLGYFQLCPPRMKTYYDENSIYNFCYIPDPKEGTPCYSSEDCHSQTKQMWCVPNDLDDINAKTGKCEYSIKGCIQIFEYGQIKAGPCFD